MVSSNNGGTGLPTNQTYDVYMNLTKAFEAPWFGRQQFGAYGYFGEAPTFFQTRGGNQLSGTGMGNRSFYRAGAYGHWYVGPKFDFYTLYMHGYDNVFLGNAVSAQPALESATRSGGAGMERGICRGSLQSQSPADFYRKIRADSDVAGSNS